MLKRFLMGVLLALFAGSAMAADIELKSELVLKLGQSGFAGVTGKVYEVSPGGAWTVRQFFNSKDGEIEAKGELSGAQLAKLAELVELGVQSSPALTEPDINPVSIEMSFGQHSKTVLMQSVEEVLSCCDRADGACSIVNLAAWIKMTLK